MRLHEWTVTQGFVFFRICNAVTKSHPQRSDVYKSDLDKTLPSIQETQAAFVRLKQLCVNGNSHLLPRVCARADGRPASCEALQERQSSLEREEGAFHRGSLTWSRRV